MKEQIFRDVLVMGKTFKAYALFLSGYLALALMGLFELEIAVALIHIIIIMLPLGAAAHDNGEGEDKASRQKTVRARYFMVLLAAMVSGMIGLLGGVLLSIVRAEAWPEHLSIVLRSLGTGLLVADLALPFYCKTERGRGSPCLYLAVLLPVTVLFGMFRLSVPAYPQWKLICYLLLALAGFGLSFSVSCRTAEPQH